MLTWLTSRLNGSSDDNHHPLGRDKSIDAFLAEVPTVDPQRTLRELLDWLGDPTGLMDAMPLDRAIRAVERLDEFAQDAVGRCWTVLLAEAQAHRSIQHAAGLLKSYFTGSHACYRLILERLAASGQETDKRQLAKFGARAMYNWVQLKKLGRMTYQSAEPAWWEEAHALLAQVREAGVTHTTLTIYPQHQLLSSIWKEYLIGLLFETAPLTNLSVNEIDAADRLVRWIEPHCRFVDVCSDLTPFWILPEGRNMPGRCQENGDYGPDVRFFGIGQGQAQLTQLNAAITREQKLPEWLTTSGCNRQQIQLLLQKLIINWSASPPSRRHPRLSAKGTIRVVNGLDMVRRMLAASEFARSGRDLDYDNYLKNFHARHREHAVVTDTPPAPPKTPMDVLRLLETAGDQQMMEQWEVIDVSRGGMGVRFTARRPWQRIGALMAFRMEDELSWRVGIIRRLGSSHGRPNAGLTCFGGTPVCSQIRLEGDSPATDTWSHGGNGTQGTAGQGWYNAVLLSAEAKLVLIPSGLFSSGRPVQLSLQGVWRPVRLLKLHGRGADYDLASFLEEGAAPPQE
jgi:hypothetical protein